LKISQTQEIRFSCDCSRDRVMKALSAIGKADLLNIIADQEDVEVNCDFCREKYHFSADDLQSIVDLISVKEV